MQKVKLYKFSSDTLSFQEAKWTRTRLVLSGLVLGSLLLFSLLYINQRYNNVLGINFVQQSTLISENVILKNQLHYLTRRLETIQKQLAVLGDKGNELRLLADLPKIDDDIRKVGTGGVEETIEYTSSPAVNDLLNSLRETTDKAERQLQLQLRSYEVVETTVSKNKVRFSHLPAIIPMNGFYSPDDFGMRNHPILHIVRKHEGIDIINEVGTPVYASADGVVQFTGHKAGYGLTIEIDHGYSFTTLFGHLSKVIVREGQRIKRGDLIARSGNSGLSNGPHLHYEVRINGAAQNPVDYFFDDVKATDFHF